MARPSEQRHETARAGRPSVITTPGRPDSRRRPPARCPAPAARARSARARRRARRAAALTQCTARAHFRGRVRGRGREARRGAAPAGPAGRRPCRRPRASSSAASRRICSYAGQLVGRSLDDERDPELRGALRRGLRRARREQADPQAGALRPDDRRAVAGCGTPSTRCRRACSRMVPSVSTPSTSSSSSRICRASPAHAVRSSACATDRAGGRLPRRSGSSSTTMTDVILWVSMIRSASTARTSRGTVSGLARHDVAGGERQHVAAAGVMNRRRRSPSVKTPASRPSSSTTRRHAEALARHLVDDLGHARRRGATRGAASPPLHHVLDAHQPLAELAARVQRREVLFAEALADRAASSRARRRAPAPRSCSRSARGSSGRLLRRCCSRARRRPRAPSVDAG